MGPGAWLKPCPGTVRVRVSLGAVRLGAPTIAIAAGYQHTRAIFEGGGVKCRAQDDKGQQLGYASDNTKGDEEGDMDGLLYINFGVSVAGSTLLCSPSLPPSPTQPSPKPEPPPSPPPPSPPPSPCFCLRLRPNRLAYRLPYHFDYRLRSPRHHRRGS